MEIAPSYVAALQRVAANDAALVPKGQHIFIEKSGGYSGEATPVPISNTEVKLSCADDTWWETAWESRSSPVFLVLWSSG